MEIEEDLRCLHCHEKSVIYIWDNNRKLILFYVNPNLEDEKVRHVFELRDITREQDPPETHCIEMKCVSCGEWAIVYPLPLDWKAQKGSGILEPTYIPKRVRYT